MVIGKVSLVMEQQAAPTDTTAMFRLGKFQKDEALKRVVLTMRARPLMVLETHMSSRPYSDSRRCSMLLGTNPSLQLLYDDNGYYKYTLISRPAIGT